MKKPGEQPRFQTHIAEPRWQQVVSVIVVGLAVLAWGWLLFSHR